MQCVSCVELFIVFNSSAEWLNLSIDLWMESFGYYYYGSHGELQGPFRAEQLASWRDFFPDNLTIYALNSHGQWEQGMCFRLLHLLLMAEVRALSLPAIIIQRAVIWKDVRGHDQRMVMSNAGVDGMWSCAVCPWRVRVLQWEHSVAG